MLTISASSRMTSVILVIVFLSWRHLQPVGAKETYLTKDNDDYSEPSPPFLHSIMRAIYAKDLVVLESMDREIEAKIAELRKQQYAISSRKRNHVMCMVHIVSCYKRRRK